MKDIKIFANDFGYFSLHDSAQDILNKFNNRDDIIIEVKDNLTIIRDKNNKESDTNAIMAFVSDGQNIKIIDACSCNIIKICVNNKEYTLKEFKEKFSNKQNAFTYCELTNSNINPFELHRECNSICAKNNLECYLNCSMCGELKHRVVFNECGEAVTYWDSLDDIMVSLERLE